MNTSTGLVLRDRGTKLEQAFRRHSCARRLLRTNRGARRALRASFKHLALVAAVILACFRRRNGYVVRRGSLRFLLLRRENEKRAAGLDHNALVELATEKLAPVALVDPQATNPLHSIVSH
jgi:hypothetical protein